MLPYFIGLPLYGQLGFREGRKPPRKLWTFTNTISQQARTTTQTTSATTPKESTIAEESITPRDVDIIPQEQSVVPEEKSMLPEEKIIKPQEKIIIPQEETFIPQEKIIIPQEASTIPKEENTIPQEIGIINRPEDVISQPKNTIIQEESDVREVGKEAQAAQKNDSEKPQEPNNRMHNMVADLLAYNRLKSSKEMIEDVRLEDVLDQVKENLRKEITDTETIIEASNLPVVKGIPAQIYLLLQNLLNNAIQYRQNGVTNRIVITGADVHFSDLPDMSDANHRHYHRIVVKDNGMGFSQEYAQKAFDMFTRLHRDQAPTGSGVGLTICKKVVENHDGLIYVQSTPGVGTTFSIYLPHEE